MNCLLLALIGGFISESLSLVPGWNAVYIESTPEEPGAETFFADMPVTRAAAYSSEVFSLTEQIATDGAAVSPRVPFTVWERGKPAESSLKSISGGRVYLIYATNTASKTFIGLPAQPRTYWRPSDDGFLTFVGISADKGEKVSASVYFREGPAGRASAMKTPTPYGVVGNDEAMPEFMALDLFSDKPKVEGGKAYAIECDSTGDWPGVIDVSTVNASGTLAITTNSPMSTLTVRNCGKTNRVVRLTLIDSAKPGDVRPGLVIYGPWSTEDGVKNWKEFTSEEISLGPGDSKGLTFALSSDSSTLQPLNLSTLQLSAVIRVEDLSGTKMRVHVPVAAQPSLLGAQLPSGLWLGEIKLVRVNRGPGTEPETAGGEMKLQTILYQPTNDAAKLLQRVDLPARRISAVFPDMAHRRLPASSGSFGSELVFDWVVDKDAVDNPFKHVWHHDHGSGWDVTNHVRLAWTTESGESTYERNPDGTTYGRCEWTLGGLSSKGEIKMLGTFALKKIMDEVEEED